MSLQFELVIPAYNEARNLKMLLERVVSSAKSFGFDSGEFRLLLVNNGSTDDSRKELSKILSEQPDLASWIKVVEISINQGYGHGIWTGLQASSAEFVGWTHADMQCDPVNAFKALEVLKVSAENRLLVKGVRHGRSRKEVFVSQFFALCARLILGVHLYEINAQPKVFKRGLLVFLKDPPKTFAFDLYVLYCALKNKYTIKTIDVTFPPRIHGVSNWAATFLGRYKTIWGMIVYMWDLRKKDIFQ